MNLSHSQRTLALHLFGALRLEKDGVAIRFRRRKAAALLAYLAVNRQPHSRETLATLFWPESDQAHARFSLRRHLSSLNKSLGTGKLAIDRTSISFVAGDDSWIDVLRFRELLADCQTHGHAPDKTCPECLPLLDEAIMLYADDFLRGFTLADSPGFDDWQRYETESLRADLEHALERLARTYAAQGDYATAIGHVRRWVAMDPLDEPPQQLLVQLYAESGQQSAAKRQFEEYAQLLATELGVDIGHEFVDVYRAALERRSPRPLDTRGLSQETRQDSNLPASAAKPAFLQEESEPATARFGPFVARDQQISQLNRYLEAVLSGQGKVAFVTGEAGSGKTTLVRAFAHLAQNRYPDLVVAMGTCHVYTGVGDPYLPFREILAMLSGDVEAQWASGTITREHAVRLWHLLPQVTDALVANGPDLLGPFVSGRELAARAAAHESTSSAWRERLYALLAHVRNQGPDQSRLFEEYADVLQALAGQQPLLLILDDLHWADISSISLLFHLARTLGRNRILVVGTLRPEEAVRSWARGARSLESVISEIKRQYGDVEVSLDRDEPEEGHRFVSALLNLEPNRLDESFRQALFRHGRGHPLFTVELLRDLQDRRVLIQDAAGRWTASPNLTWDAMPARVEGVIEQRVGRLDTALRELLSVASVVGEVFAGEVVASVLESNERQTVHWLSADLQKQHRLVRAEGMRRVGDRRLSFYRFGHSLFQRYMYQNLDEVERAHLHEAVGVALEKIYEGQDELASFSGVLAHHFEEAGLLDKASHYRLLAGRHAAQISAHQEAIVHLSQGLALLESMPQSPERSRRSLALQLALAVSITTTSGYANPDAYEVYARARSLSQQVGGAPDVFQALYGLWRYALIHAELEDAQNLAEQLMELSQEAQDSGLLVEAYRSAGVTLFHLGDFTAARPALEQGVAVYDAEQHRTHAFLYGHDPAASCLAYLAHTLWMLGELEQAKEQLRELLRLAWDLAHPFTLAYSQIFGAAINYQLQRDVPGVLEWTDAGLGLSRRRGFPFWRAQALVLRGWALAQRGDGANGAAQIREGLGMWQATGALGLLPYYTCLLAEACATIGDVESGLAAVEEGLAAIARTNERFYEAELYRVQGELFLLSGDRSPAQRAFERALEIAQEKQALSLEARASASLNRL